MFSLPISWPSSSAFARAFSLDCWLAHLRSWHHPENLSPLEVVPSHYSKKPVDAVFFPGERLVLDLPSPTVHWSFDYLAEEFNSDSDSDSTNGDHLETDFDAPKTPFPPFTNDDLGQAAASPPATNRNSLLAQYSEQELVLLEFLTHSHNFKDHDIDDVLYLYPPGFSNECQCDPEDDVGGNLCEVCQLTEAYLDSSFERYNGRVAVLQ